MSRPNSIHAACVTTDMSLTPLMPSCSLFVTTHGSPLPEKGPPTLSLHAVLTAALTAFGDATLDLDDVEAMCASLMEQVS